MFIYISATARWIKLPNALVAPKSNSAFSIRYIVDHDMMRLEFLVVVLNRV